MASGQSHSVSVLGNGDLAFHPWRVPIEIPLPTDQDLRPEPVGELFKILLGRVAAQ